jgi:sortase A
MRRSSSRWMFLEKVLLVVAVLALGWYGLSVAESSLYQLWQGRALDEQLREQMRGLDRTVERGVPPGAVLGRLEIPRLALSVIIREGEDPRTLRLAVGHLPGTAWPGRPGNAAIAGHRDTFFRTLRHIERHDEILVTTSNDVSRYVVVSTRVVHPDDVSVLKSTDESVLTLVTCYPFFYVGRAPQRFIVRAMLAGGRAPAGTAAAWSHP